MKNFSIPLSLTLRLSAMFILFSLFFNEALAQGVTVRTRDGRSTDYPASTFSRITPYIQNQSTTSKADYGIDVFKSDGSSDRYMEQDLYLVTPYDTHRDEQGEPQTTVVPQTGGKVSMGSMTIDIPSGTFNSDAKVAMVEAKKGYIDGNDELSQYYKVTLPGVSKPIKVSVTMPKIDDDEFVRMQFATMGWAPSVGEEGLVYCYADVTYENGAYVAEIPAMEAPDEIAEIEVYFGITKCNPVDGAAATRTRAGSSEGKDFVLYNKVEDTDNVATVLSKLKSWISAAIIKLEELGYRKPEGCIINCYLKKTGGAFGCCSFNPLGKEYSTISFFYDWMGGKDENIYGTVIHELFHYYQQFYDPRPACILTLGKIKTTDLILDEASSVWSEGLNFISGETLPKTPYVAKDNAWLFVPSINADHKDILAPSNGVGMEWSERYQNVGYGAASLIEYLTQKCGNKILLEMWEERKTGGIFGVSDTKGRIERFANKYGIDIFSQDGYHDFVEKIGIGEVFKELTFPDLINIREEHDTIGEQFRVVESIKPIYHTNYVYCYGALVEKLDVKVTGYKGDIKLTKDNGYGYIELTEDGLATWVYLQDGKEPVGKIRKGSPLKIKSEWFVDKNNSQRDVLSFYFVTIADDFKNTPDRVSRIVSNIFPIEIPSKQVSVPSSKGSSNVVMRTECYDLDFNSSADWLTCFWSVTDQALKIYYEEMPSNMASRKATIEVFITTDGKTKLVLDEIEVTQLPAYINLSETDFKIPVKGDTKEITITSTNCSNLKVTPWDNFLHPTISGSTITVKVDENPSYEVREGTVEVSGVMAETNIEEKRYIHFTQEAAPSPDIVNLYNNGSISSTVPGVQYIWAIPGQTTKYGNYLRYSSHDTQIEKTSDGRTELSWTVDLYIDPKDDKGMRNYEFYSGSVSWLRNNYWTEKDDKGNTTEHQLQARCSYNLKNLTTKDGLTFMSWVNADSVGKLSEFVTDYSYEFTEDGKTTYSYTQADIIKETASMNSVYIKLYLADGVPYLEADRDSINFDGGDTFELLSYSTNEAIIDVTITTSDTWLTIDRVTDSNSYYLKIAVNNSKAPRTGQVYITGTVADGSKLTRTIIVSQEYDPAWDDERETDEEQKAELPSQSVLDALANVGMPLYLGDTPPKLNGTYKMEPLTTVYESDGNHDVERDISYLVFHLTSQSNKANRGMLSYYSHITSTNTNSAPSDYICHLSGDGNCFTLSNIWIIDFGFGKYSVVTIASGEIDGDTVKDLHLAIVELDENNVIENISIGTDGDGISTTTKWEPGTEEY